MRILILGSTYLTELCVNQLLKDGFNLVGYIPSENPTFRGRINLKEVTEDTPHDIKLSIQYDLKVIDVRNAYNLHTGLLPLYGGCSILYHTIKNKDVEQGLTFHKMTQNFDDGEIISKMSYPVLPTDKVEDLYMRMCSIAPKFLSNALSLNVVGKSYIPTLHYKKDVPDDVSKRDREEIAKRIETKSCKIIAISFAEGRDVRTNVYFPSHNQDAGSSEDLRQMVEDLFSLEIKQDAGVPMDIYLINSDVGYERGNKWLNEINGTKTKNGILYVLHRENIGGSFGAYDFAYRALRDKYEYFMFTEDDLFIFGDRYYKKAINMFEKYDLGFLSFIDIEWVRNIIHCHGGVGLTHKKILEQVFRKFGELPHAKDFWDKPQVIRDGEIPFTNSIHDMGYELVRFGTGEWDKKNCLLPYFDYKRIPK